MKRLEERQVWDEKIEYLKQDKDKHYSAGDYSSIRSRSSSITSSLITDEEQGHKSIIRNLQYCHIQRYKDVYIRWARDRTSKLIILAENDYWLVSNRGQIRS